MPASRAPLTRDSFRVKIAVQRVRLGGRDYRVIRPAGPLKNGALYRQDDSYDMYVDRTDGRRIGTLFLLAARSPRSLVYLPMRNTATSPGADCGDERPLDLVLAHPEVQLRPSRWKQLRTRINAGNAPRELRTARVPERDLPDLDAAFVFPDDPKEADALSPRRHVYADTLILTGHAVAFRDGAKEIFAVTRDGPPEAATKLYIPGPGCNYHVCRCVFDWDTPDGRGWEPLHAQFTPAWAR
ncbi:hypothetical protein AB0D04_21535 [Streptomyces sp. NPDC048483]|uniref:hypothetical protein n=1 Tax=Streptomyces sp. NPDC048483 TaxID=3154927 RepID=UPI00342256F8